MLPVHTRGSARRVPCDVGSAPSPVRSHDSGMVRPVRPLYGAVTPADTPEAIHEMLQDAFNRHDLAPGHRGADYPARFGARVNVHRQVGPCKASGSKTT